MPSTNSQITYFKRAILTASTLVGGYMGNQYYKNFINHEAKYILPATVLLRVLTKLGELAGQINSYLELNASPEATSQITDYLSSNASSEATSRYLQEISKNISSLYQSLDTHKMSDSRSSAHLASYVMLGSVGGLLVGYCLWWYIDHASNQAIRPLLIENDMIKQIRAKIREKHLSHVPKYPSYLGENVYEPKIDTPDEFICPISKLIIIDPIYIEQDNHNYERAALQEWYECGKRTTPLTRSPLSNPADLTTNELLRQTIAEHINNQTCIQNITLLQQVRQHLEQDIKNYPLPSKGTPTSFVCPITKRIIQDPIYLKEDNKYYERKALICWKINFDTCPINSQKSLPVIESLPTDLSKKYEIQRYLTEKKELSDKMNEPLTTIIWQNVKEQIPRFSLYPFGFSRTNIRPA